MFSCFQNKNKMKADVKEHFVFQETIDKNVIWSGWVQIRKVKCLFSKRFVILFPNGIMLTFPHESSFVNRERSSTISTRDLVTPYYHRKMRLYSIQKRSQVKYILDTNILLCNVSLSAARPDIMLKTEHANELYSIILANVQFTDQSPLHLAIT